ncbi:MAG: hypothetical protein JWO80_5875 [Bryobacterales bacterium]|nr:hypothetical protein [Bryobacterales bacterium]
MPDRAGADRTSDITVDLALQRNPGIRVQIDRRNGKLTVMDQSGPLRRLFPLCTFGEYREED